jgi:hypothetical protein
VTINRTSGNARASRQVENARAVRSAERGTQNRQVPRTQRHLSARAGFCDRDHSVHNVLSDRFAANGPMAKYFHDETEYCDEEAALQDRTVRPRGELILCVYAKRETLEFETKASDHISNGSCTGTVVLAEKTTIKLAKIA